ncbi:hypothetical protein F5Y05DRAFT_289764 [Hypoxylon sp. FL0543]|nr:hypothetical protein F5Y05DRAFT_289764 [Hypoxylon sp. FL0543]
MRLSRGVPLDVTSDSTNGRIPLQDAFNKMPSLATLKRSALVFITDAKQPRNGDQQSSSNCTSIRELIRRPRRHLRKTNSTQTQNRSQKGSEVQYEENSRRRDAREDDVVPLGLGAGLGAAGTRGGKGGHGGRGTSTSTSTGAENLRAKASSPAAATTTLHALFFLFAIPFLRLFE